MPLTESSYSVQLGERGRLVLPAPLRKRMNLRAGDELILTLEPNGCLRLASVPQVVRESRGMYGKRAGGRSLVDELIAERRAEARRDSSAR